MSCNQPKGTHCPCGKRWAVCKDCSPSQAIAHFNRVKNNNIIKTPLDSVEYRLIDNMFRYVLQSHDLTHLRKKRIPAKIWEEIEPEIFKGLKSILNNYHEINDDNYPIGCDIRWFKYNIQRQLKKGMKLGVIRKGIWDLDHICPCARFDLTCVYQRRVCFNYKNFRPLWTYLNQQKGGR